HDEFDDGNIGTNTGTGHIGTGFVVNGIDGSPNVAAGETGGLATVSGGASNKALVSKDPIDPRGTTLTWQIATRPSTDTNGTSVGWTVPSGCGCCADGVYLGIEGGRVVFDLTHRVTPSSPQISRYFTILTGSSAPNEVYTNTSSALTASVFVDANG